MLKIFLFSLLLFSVGCHYNAVTLPLKEINQPEVNYTFTEQSCGHCYSIPSSSTIQIAFLEIEGSKKQWINPVFTSSTHAKLIKMERLYSSFNNTINFVNFIYKLSDEPGDNAKIAIYYRDPIFYHTNANDKVFSIWFINSYDSTIQEDKSKEDVAPNNTNDYENN